MWLSVLTEQTPSLEGLILAQGPDAKAELVWFRGPVDPQTLLEASEGASVHLVPVLEPRGPLKTPTQALTSGRPVRAWGSQVPGVQAASACLLSEPSQLRLGSWCGSGLHPHSPGLWVLLYWVCIH